MGEVAEIRKIFQDLIAPDVKSIATDVAAFKAGVDKQFRNAADLATARYEVVVAKMETMEAKLTSMETTHAIRHEAILKPLDIDKRLEKIEARQAAGTAA